MALVVEVAVPTELSDAVTALDPLSEFTGEREARGLIEAEILPEGDGVADAEPEELSTVVAVGFSERLAV